MQDCKDGSGLQFIKFDFVTGGQEIIFSIVVEFWRILVVICLFISYFFTFISFRDFFFQFQDNKVNLKEAPEHDHENTIFPSARTLYL